MITKALIYCRVSSLRQAIDGHGLDSQELRCRNFAKSKNYIVEKVFPDSGVSGGLFERPAMKALINYLDNHPIEKYAIIFDDLARFARDVKVHIQLKIELQSRGVKLECLNFNFEDSPESEYAEIILAAGNQYQRKQNKRQVINRMKARIERGYWSFCNPPGFKYISDPVHGKLLVRNEPFASIFQRMMEGYASDILNTREELAEFINSEYKKVGISKRISCDGVHRILINPLYCGYIAYTLWNINLMPAQHQGIISIATFQKIQNKLKNRSKPFSGKNYSKDFPLRKFLLCTKCLKPMTASWNSGRHVKYPNYFCKSPGCEYKWKVTRKQTVESGFSQLLVGVTPASEVVDLTTVVFNDVWKSVSANFQVENNQIVSRIQEINLLVSSLSLRVAKTTEELLITSYEAEIKKLQKEKEELEGKIVKDPYTQETFGTALDIVMTTIKDPVGMWQSDKLEQKKVLLSMYFEERIPYDYHKGFGTTTLAYPIALMNESSGDKTHLVEMSADEAECEKV